MDRNTSFGSASLFDLVALRKESVDRNHIRHTTAARPSVALRKESVDRNHVVLVAPSGCWLSLSARRAWIEIPAGCWRDSRRACRSPQGERG